MKYVLDASVAVAALRKREPHHDEALRRCLPLFAGRDEIVVPTIFDVEVVSALVRRGATLASVDRFFEKHFASRQLVTRLRAADSFYVWVAAREGLSLVTTDAKVIARAASVCRVELP